MALRALVFRRYNSLSRVITNHHASFSSAVGSKYIGKSPKKTADGFITRPALVSWYSTRTHRKIVQRDKPRDLYAVLNVSPSATQKQVKDAYYKLSMKYHPDRNEGSPEAHLKFTSLTEAYSILGQYDRRKKYDKGLLHHYPGRQHQTQHPTTSSRSEERSTHFASKKAKINFDFDEFYRAHYGDALKRQREDKKKHEEARVRSSYYRVSDSIQQVMIVGVILVAYVSGSYISRSSNTREKFQ